MYLDDKDITPKKVKEARDLIGKKVEYIRRCDVDRYRGVASSRKGTIEEVVGKNLVINGDYLYFADIFEMIIIE